MSVLTDELRHHLNSTQVMRAIRRVETIKQQDLLGVGSSDGGNGLYYLTGNRVLAHISRYVSPWRAYDVGVMAGGIIGEILRRSSAALSFPTIDEPFSIDLYVLDHASVYEREGENRFFAWMEFGVTCEWDRGGAFNRSGLIKGDGDA